MKNRLLVICMIFATVLYGCGNQDIVEVEIESLNETVVEAVTEIDLEAADESEEQVETEVEAVTTNTEVQSNDEENKTEAAKNSESIVINNAPANKKIIKVAVTGDVAVEILEQVNELGDDYYVEIIKCSDYNTPNEMLTNGEADASLFQNQVFMNSYNKLNDAELCLIDRIYYEPLALFGGKIESINSLKKNMKIAVMDDDITVARALHFLNQKGIITLKEDTKFQACLEDIINNPYGVELVRVNYDSEKLNREQYDLVIIDSNRAILAGINPDNNLGRENRNSEIYDMFAIALVTSTDKKDSSMIEELRKLLDSDEVDEYIYENYYGAVESYR